MKVTFRQTLSNVVQDLDLIIVLIHCFKANFKTVFSTYVFVFWSEF